MKSLIIIAAVILLVGCRTPTIYEQATYDCLMEQGAEPQENYDATSAGVLNVFFGIGDVMNEEYGLFAFDLILWPISILWAPAQGAITAKNKNIKYTVDYYTETVMRDEYVIDTKAIQLRMAAIKAEEEARKAALREKRMNELYD